MTGLSTHVLDTTSGKPAANLRVTLSRSGNEMFSALTDSNGRIASLLPPASLLQTGIYQLIFDAGAYFPEGFYPQVIITFHVRDANAHHHIPLLLSPFGYSTYRGS